MSSLGAVQNQPHGAEGLETFPNPIGDNLIDLTIPEFTCLCPKTGQPDFATIRIRYVPRDLCVESKSLKLYVWSFRNVGAFHEAVTKKFLDDLVDCLDPKWMQVMGIFGVRGGIYEQVLVERVAIDGDDVAVGYEFDLEARP
jgi:7-cyano-7-deazaguanine reductase